MSETPSHPIEYGSILVMVTRAAVELLKSRYDLSNAHHRQQILAAIRKRYRGDSIASTNIQSKRDWADVDHRAVFKIMRACHSSFPSLKSEPLLLDILVTYVSNYDAHWSLDRRLAWDEVNLALSVMKRAAVVLNAPEGTQQEIDAAIRRSSAPHPRVASGTTAVPLAMLPRNDQNQLVSRLSAGYTGCEDFIRQLMDRARNEDGRCMVVVGPPGVGKSAAAAKFISEVTTLKPSAIPVFFFFIVFQDIRTTTAKAVLDSLARQVAAHWEWEFSEGLHTVGDLVAYLSDRNRELVQVDVPALRIVIDGLDELAEDQQNELTRAIRALVQEQLQVFLFSRRVQALEMLLHDREPDIVLRYEDTTILDAIVKATSRLIGRMDRAERDKQALIDSVVAKSGGQFQYMRILCRALETEKLDIEQLADLPSDMTEYYRQSLDRLRRSFSSTMEFSRCAVPVLAVLVAAGNFSISDLSRITRNSPTEIRTVIEHLMELLDTMAGGPNQRYRLCHQSVLEFFSEYPAVHDILPEAHGWLSQYYVDECLNGDQSTFAAFHHALMSGNPLRCIEVFGKTEYLPELNWLYDSSEVLDPDLIADYLPERHSLKILVQDDKVAEEPHVQGHSVRAQDATLSVAHPFVVVNWIVGKVIRSCSIPPNQKVVAYLRCWLFCSEWTKLEAIASDIRATFLLYVSKPTLVLSLADEDEFVVFSPVSWIARATYDEELLPAKFLESPSISNIDEGIVAVAYSSIDGLSLFQVPTVEILNRIRRARVNVPANENDLTSDSTESGAFYLGMLLNSVLLSGEVVHFAEGVLEVMEEAAQWLPGTPGDSESEEFDPMADPRLPALRRAGIWLWHLTNAASDAQSNEVNRCVQEKLREWQGSAADVEQSWWCANLREFDLLPESTLQGTPMFQVCPLYRRHQCSRGLNKAVQAESSSLLLASMARSIVFATKPQFHLSNWHNSFGEAIFEFLTSPPPSTNVEWPSHSSGTTEAGRAFERCLWTYRLQNHWHDDGCELPIRTDLMFMWFLEADPYFVANAIQKALDRAGSYLLPQRRAILRRECYSAAMCLKREAMLQAMETLDFAFGDVPEVETLFPDRTDYLRHFFYIDDQELAQNVLAVLGEGSQRLLSRADRAWELIRARDQHMDFSLDLKSIISKV